MQNLSEEAKNICQNIYEETRKYYSEITETLGEHALGFRILYGPPVVDAPFLFIGYQPGGRGIDCAAHHNTWPEVSDYVTQNWPLAKQVRSIWGLDVVERCTGLNVIFFRAPSVAAWNKIAKPLRQKLENFSRQHTEQIVRALRPKCLIVIGLGTFDWLTEGKPSLYGEKGRVLTRKGTLWNCEAIGTVHLSGSRISRADREHLRAYFAAIQTPQALRQTQEGYAP
ncbi:hypothetical protein [Komagataeibacter rhaeticus]|uniref:hypothetical protein n=1 Tax=Komagataeibacter rhaeticus TaxID=215221 RepID=UPI0011B4E8C4|nr:hypothetical protein [Komagataeibacter rhaeticus]MBL7241423.1 hypothetical protein [Komagataeibacter rhaeticus]GBQ09651.1 hypothetical protein AA16663_0230 [Komagataeibacter rhaeticus DSM 16663]